MGVGPNYVLDKGFVAGGSTAYKAGELVVQDSSGLGVTRATSAGADVRGVCQENIDAGRVTTGKAVIGVRLLGIARVIAGEAIAVGDRLTNDTSARAVVQEEGPVFGVALTPAAAANDEIDVLLTPGATDVVVPSP